MLLIRLAQNCMERWDDGFDACSLTHSFECRSSAAGREYLSAVRNKAAKGEASEKAYHGRLCSESETLLEPPCQFSQGSVQVGIA